MKSVLVTLLIEDDFKGSDAVLEASITAVLGELDNEWWEYHIRDFTVEVQP